MQSMIVRATSMILQVISPPNGESKPVNIKMCRYDMILNKDVIIER